MPCLQDGLKLWLSAKNFGRAVYDVITHISHKFDKLKDFVEIVRL